MIKTEGTEGDELGELFKKHLKDIQGDKPEMARLLAEAGHPVTDKVARTAEVAEDEAAPLETIAVAHNFKKDHEATAAGREIARERAKAKHEGQGEKRES